MIPDLDSIIAFLKQLVAIPSRAGIDPYEPILELVRKWGTARNIPFQPLKDKAGETVALLCTIQGSRASLEHANVPLPTYLLNATLDTATFGDTSNWTTSPTKPIIRDGWLYGRGSADSKVAVAIFCHLISEFVALRNQMRGNLQFLFDTDEHTGGFGGVRQYVEQLSKGSLSGVFLGYPGNDRIVVGSRGFTRAVIMVNGRAAHSGGSSNRGINAVQRAAQLINSISSVKLSTDVKGDFPLPPQVTVTAVHGGEGFSNIPDSCSVHVDCRVTPLFGVSAAQALVQEIIREFDMLSTDQTPTFVKWSDGWPAYQTDSNHVMVQTLQLEAERYFRRSIPTAVVGPSNIGNLLAPLGIPCIGGFGVSYRAIHANDECLELASIEPVYQTYWAALSKLLHIDEK